MNRIVTALLVLVISALPALAQEAPGAKHWNPTQPAWDPTVGLGLLNDVPSDENVNNTCPGQGINSGDVLQPAEITFQDNDYFYFFANAGDRIIFGTAYTGAGGPVDTFIHLYNADCSIELATNDDEVLTQYSLINLCSAPYTGMYVGRVRGTFSVSTGSYKAYVTCAPSGNFFDNCATAIALPCGAVNMAGNTSCSQNDYTLGPGSCTGFSAEGQDQVLRMDVHAGDSVNLTYNIGRNAVIYILSACSPETCVAGSDAALYLQPETLAYVFPADGTYYLVLDSTSGSGSWTLTGTFTCNVTPTVPATWGTLKMRYR